MTDPFVPAPVMLGPLGQLRALPSPSISNPPEATATRIGTVHRSLTGRPTVDRLAVRRTWSWTWPYLDADNYTYLDALHQGLVAGPLWLIDPVRPNRLPPGIASGGAVDHAATGFTPTGGPVDWASTQLAAPIPLPGVIRWVPPTSGGRLDATPAVPVLPGETITVSMRVSTVQQVRVGLRLLDANGTIVADLQSTPTAPNGPGGQRLDLTATAPTTAVSCRIGLLAPGDLTGSLVLTNAWQIEAAPFATAWKPGGGAAQVVVDTLTVSYPVPGSYATTITLLEV